MFKSKHILLIAFALLCIRGASQNLYQLEPLSWLPANASVSHLAANKTDIFIGTDIGLFTSNGTAAVLKFPGGVSALVANDKEAWVAIGDDLKNTSTGASLLLPRQAKITSLAVNGNTLWVGTETGLFQANLQSGRIEELTNRNSKFNKSAVNFVHVDDKKILWIGTNNGDYRVADGKWKHYHKGSNVLDFYENNEGIWFVSKDDMWLIDPFNREYPVGLDEDLAVGKLRDFCLDKKGILYFASDNLVRYDPYKTKIDAFNDEITKLTNETTALLPYKDAILIGTKSKGMYSLGFLDSMAMNVNIVMDKLLTCAPGSEAQISAFVKGGQPPYAFEWNKNIKGSSTLSGLGVGDVYLKVTDATGRVSDKTITINPPAKPIIALERIESGHQYLADGAIYLQKLPGQKYVWSTGTEGETLKNVIPGNYTVTVTDAIGCSNSESFTVNALAESVLINLDTVAVGEVVQVDNILFKADSTEVLGSSLPVLNQIMDFIVSNPKVNIEIGGHTNTIPSHEYCDKLSTDRARNIAQFFYDKGVPTTRVTYKGYGKRQPITNDQSLEGRRKNQRVEIKILAK